MYAGDRNAKGNAARQYGSGFVRWLEDMVLENYKSGTLHFTTDAKEAIADSKISFIAVGTPMGEDGSADLQYVLAVAKSIGQHMQDYLVVVDKSTVPVGTADKVRATIQAELDARGVDIMKDHWLGGNSKVLPCSTILVVSKISANKSFISKPGEWRIYTDHNRPFLRFG